MSSKERDKEETSAKCEIGGLSLRPTKSRVAPVEMTI